MHPNRDFFDERTIYQSVISIYQDERYIRIEIRRSVHPNRDFFYKQLIIQNVLLP